MYIKYFINLSVINFVIPSTLEISKLKKKNILKILAKKRFTLEIGVAYNLSELFKKKLKVKKQFTFKFYLNQSHDILT